jgi:hypothetical protein
VAPKTANFLIIAGAVTALGLPFALAFPPTFFLKLGAVAGLVLLACVVATLFRRR